ncbi:hypothetical protein SUGI_0734750 [Cryptomeria japonica]|nr:hypothetical protein SUGI_0734750 [Cryptomeria japonica]
MKLFVILTVLSILDAVVYGSDPDPLTDYTPGVTSFVLHDIFTNGDIISDTGGIRAAASVDNFPAMQSQGLTYVWFKLVPCGVNLPHTHPRASEMLALISGGPLQVGLVDTQGNVFIDIMYPGDVTIFPRGTLHFQLNLGKEEAHFIATLNSENPGVLISSESILKLPLIAVATAFNITQHEVKGLRSLIYPEGPELKRIPKSGCIPGGDNNVVI